MNDRILYSRWRHILQQPRTLAIAGHDVVLWPVSPVGKVVARVVTEELEAIRKLVALGNEKVIAIVTNYRGDPWDAAEALQLSAIALAGSSGDVVVLLPEALTYQVRMKLGSILRDADVVKVFHDGKRHRHVLFRCLYGASCDVAWDVDACATVLDPEDSTALERLARVDLSPCDAKLSTTHEGAARAAVGVLSAYNRQQETLTTTNRLWSWLVSPGIEALESVERIGIRFDVDAGKNCLAVIEARLERIERRLSVYGLDDRDDVDEATPEGRLHSQRDKLERKASVVRRLLASVSPLDSRVHTSFRLGRTGRLSSSRPCIHNVGKARVEDELGGYERDCFVASPGHVLVGCDIRQMDPTAAAMLSGDWRMRAAVVGGDFHRRTAAIINGIEEVVVTDRQRAEAKTIGLQVLYGGGSADMRERLFAAYPGLGEWMASRWQQAQETGQVVTEWSPAEGGEGWRQARPVVTNTVAYNTSIQTLSAWLCMRALTELVDWTRRGGYEHRLVMQIHDEFLFETPVGRVTEVVAKVQEVIGRLPTDGVPLRIGVTVGRSWGDMRRA